MLCSVGSDHGSDLQTDHCALAGASVTSVGRRQCVGRRGAGPPAGMERNDGGLVLPFDADSCVSSPTPTPQTLPCRRPSHGDLMLPSRLIVGGGGTAAELWAPQFPARATGCPDFGRRHVDQPVPGFHAGPGHATADIAVRRTRFDELTDDIAEDKVEPHLQALLWARSSRAASWLFGVPETPTAWARRGWEGWTPRTGGKRGKPRTG